MLGKKNFYCHLNSKGASKLLFAIDVAIKH